jgi:N-acetylglutamate synthase-like GNAT family acetyltransferase
VCVLQHQGGGAMYLLDGQLEERPAVNGASQPAEPRQATVADLPSIHRVIAAAYDSYLGRMDKPPAPLLRDYSPAIEAGAIWVTGSPVTGLISLSQVDDVILIENVAVHPDLQGRGLGRRLMDFAEQYAANRQVRRLALYTNEVMTEKTLPASEVCAADDRASNPT